MGTLPILPPTRSRRLQAGPSAPAQVFGCLRSQRCFTFSELTDKDPPQVTFYHAVRDSGSLIFALRFFSISALSSGTSPMGLHD